MLAATERCSELPETLIIELKAKRMFAQDQFLHWIAACTKPAEVLDVIPTILRGPGYVISPTQRAAAVELLDAIIVDPELRTGLSSAIECKESYDRHRSIRELEALSEPLISKLLKTEILSNPRIERDMDFTERAMLLRNVDLFEALSGDVLVSIAEITEAREMTSGETIFLEVDARPALSM